MSVVICMVNVRSKYVEAKGGGEVREIKLVSMHHYKMHISA